MLKLVKICVFSMVVSFAAFSNDNETVDNSDTQALQLDEQNPEYFLDFVKDAFSSIKNFVVGKILGGCDEVKKAGITSENQIPSKDSCDADSATKDTCLSNIKLMKSCL